MNLTELSKQVFEANKEKGFWDKERNVGEMLMLVVSELGEAIEAHRKERFADETNFDIYNKNPHLFFKTYSAFELSKKISSKRLQDGFTARDVQRGNWHLLTDRETIGAALTELEETGWIRPLPSEPNPMGGRPTVAYKILNSFEGGFEKYIKDTFEDEIADSIIRLLDLCGGLCIDIQKHVELKLKYNQTREKLHGKKY